MLEETQLLGSPDGLGPIAGGQLGVDVMNMPSGGAEADDELVGNILVRMAFRKQTEHFEFLPRQRLRQWIG